MIYIPQTKEELQKLIKDNNINLGDIQTHLITDMSSLFSGSKRLDFSGIESWDVSNVTDMSSMFNKCISFNQPLDDWNVENVIDMSFMFSGCCDFNRSLEKWGWKVSKVEFESYMFEGCRSLKTKPSWYEWLVEKCQDEFDDECDETLE